MGAATTPVIPVQTRAPIKIPKKFKKHPSFDLGPPPQPKLPAWLKPPTNRNRFTAATTPLSLKVPEAAATTTEVSLFVTNPNFTPAAGDKTDDNEHPSPVLPASNPTQ